MMTPMPLIYLSDEERKNLLELINEGPELLSHRAKLILAYAEGKPTLQAANEAGISRGRARFWKRQFLSKRMAIFESIVVTQPGDFEEELGEETAQVIEEAGQNLLVEEPTISPTSEEPYPQPREKIGILPEDTLAEAGKKVWQYYFAEMLCHEEGTLRGEDIEELHDMRVATRRMRTAFDVFGSAFEEKIMKRHLAGLRKIGRTLGAVRDMDVILQNAIDYQKKLKETKQAGLNPLLFAWQNTIENQREEMAAHLQSEKYRDFKVSFNHFLLSDNTDNVIANPAGIHNASIRDSVPAFVYSRYAAVKAYETLVPTASLVQLHALRIEFKKFRYTLEYFREVLGEGIEQVINEIKQIQDHLGTLHDADVTVTLVQGFLKTWEKSQPDQAIIDRQNPEPVVDYLAYEYAERYRLVRTFPELWTKFSRVEFRHLIAEAVTRL